MPLHDRARNVRTREDLVSFLGALSADYEANRGSWENADLASFLAAIGNWAEDMDGFYANTGQDLATLPPWRIIADLLLAARSYE